MATTQRGLVLLIAHQILTHGLITTQEHAFLNVQVHQIFMPTTLQGNMLIIVVKELMLILLPEDAFKLVQMDIMVEMRHIDA